MRGSVIRHLILKDWRLHRLQIILCIGVGLAALTLLQHGGEVPIVLGSVWFFVSLCVLASMLPNSVIVNERKKQTLAFAMSLPISSVQYTIAKAASMLGMFLLPWLMLLISALVLIETRHILPHGVIPTVFITAMLPVVGFSLIAGMALVGETEGWVIAASIVCNSSYGVGWYLLCRIPSLLATWKTDVVVWNSAAVTLLGSELGFIALIAAITVFVQSRKRDFI